MKTADYYIGRGFLHPEKLSIAEKYRGKPLVDALDATDGDEISYYLTGCSMTQWNEDCEQIMAEAKRILNEYNLYGHDRNTNVANSNQLVTVLEILKKIK